MKDILHLLVAFCILFPVPGLRLQALSDASQAPKFSNSSTQTSPRLPASVDAAWLQAAQENIRRSEYHLASQAGTYAATNRAHNLHITFETNRVRIAPHVSPHTWDWGLRLAAYGYRDDLRPIGKPTQHVAENRITYRRDGLDEWYVNGDGGLEQGFTLHTPPPGGAADEVVLEMALSGTLVAQVRADGEGIALFSQDGVAVLHFGQLHAFDANRAGLPTRMELDGNRLRLSVQVADAVYPVTVDPLATSPSWEMESNQAAAQLGFAVASAGDVNGDGYDDIIVSAPYFDSATDGGRVFVFHGSSSGPGVTAAWTAAGGQAGAQFGWSVASAGDFNGDGYADVLIGARAYDNTPADEGAAFVWYGSAGGLSCGSGCPTDPAAADWQAESDQAGAGFGFSLAAAGDIDGDGYGDVLIGAPNYEDNSPTEDDEGWAFLYLGGAAPDANADWTASSNQAGAVFGHAVASAGDFNGDGYGDVLIGAYGFDNGIYTNDGSAYLWFGSAGGLGAAGTPANAAWGVSGGQDNAQLGASVAAAGDVNGDGYGDVILGAPGYSDTLSAEGRAFAYYGSATPDTGADWQADGEQASSAFGVVVASAGDTNGDGYADILVGANLYTQGFSAEGAAFAWFGSGSGLGANGAPGNAGWSVAGGQGNAYLGAAAASAGDVNGDGYSDLIAGAPGYTNAENGEGRAQLFYGGSDSVQGNITEHAWAYEANIADSWLGASTASAGDVNGDGYDDIIVGALLLDRGTYVDEGAAYVFYGSANGPGTTPSWIAYGSQASYDNVGNFGVSVDTAGDVNGDGYSDIIVGAYYHDNGQSDEGTVFVWYGSPTGLACTGSPCTTTPASASWYAESNQAGATLGIYVKSAGDVNGDGFDDILAGARTYDVGTISDAGAVFAWYGSPTGLGANGNPANADWRVDGDQANALLGNEVASAGDVNGDGYGDVLVSAPRYDNGQTDEGMAFAWYGSANGLACTGTPCATTPASADWRAEGNQTGSSINGNPTGAFFGYTVAPAGDVNGDGYDDVLIGARYYDNGQIDEGMAFVWHGSAAGINGGTDGAPGNEAWNAEVNLGDAQLTYATCGTAGDVNGDGYGDLVLGASKYANGQSNEGMALLWLGSAGGINDGVNGTPANASWTLEPNVIGDYLGISLGSAGDVDGDGYDDLLIGSSRYNNGEAVEGRAYVYYGNAGSGTSILPRQRRADDTRDIAPGGQAISPDGVRLSLWARSPFGRSNVRLQWEIKPAGSAFDGTGLGHSAAWSDSGVNGVTRNESVTGLAMDTRYHWRVRLQAQPRNASAGLVSYRGPWIEGGTFFTALSGEQSITGAGFFNLLGQSASLTVTNQGDAGSLLTGLTLRGYPQTAHAQENANGGGANMLDRYFTLTPNAGASGYNVTLCLPYRDDEIPTGFDDSQLRLCRWTGTAWSCPDRAPGSSTAANLVCAANVTAFSDWTIGAGLGPTAVELNRLQTRAGTPPGAGFAVSLLLALGLLLAARLLWGKRCPANTASEEKSAD
ncbi:MAG: FG-GAP-like repeat-containing protein [Chloroflexota bacterium]